MASRGATASEMPEGSRKRSVIFLPKAADLNRELDLNSECSGDAGPSISRQPSKESLNEDLEAGQVEPFPSRFPLVFHTFPYIFHGFPWFSTLFPTCFLFQTAFPHSSPIDLHAGAFEY